MKVAKPTPAQAEAGNYKMGHVRIHGLDITIETPRGRSRRPGKWPRMAAHYGYLRRTTGSDGDHVDVFIGPHRDSQLVVVIDQVDRHGKFDEHKALIGYTSKEAAIAAYRKCFTPGWKVGPVTVMTIDQFKAWLEDGTQRHPIAGQVSKYTATADWLEQYAAKQLGFEWNEAEHPRDDAGKFTDRPWRTGKDGPSEAFKRGRDQIKVLGKIEAERPCDKCGNTNLKMAVVMDIDGHQVHYGRDCAGWALFGNKTEANAKKIDKLVDAADAESKAFRRNKTMRIGDSPQTANRQYASTKRPLEGSYFAYKGDQVVRVDGNDPKDVQFYEDEGFAKKVSADKYAADQASGHWITIGADKSQPKGKQGGSPVFIDGQGEIKKGPDSLAGKKISQLDRDKQQPAPHQPLADPQRRDVIGVGHEFEIHPKIPSYTSWNKLAITGESNGDYHVAFAEDGNRHTQTKVPGLAINEFINDLKGEIKLDKPAGDDRIQAVADGKAEFLGKGNDGLAFAVGNQVVKASTPVPFVWSNYRGMLPGQARDNLKKSVEINEKLRQAGVPGLLNQEYKEAGGKGFAIMPRLSIPEKYTPEQLEHIKQTITGMHEHGYVIGDTIQAGIAADGKPYIFDVGQARHVGNDKEYLRDDRGRVRDLYRDAGLDPPFWPEEASEKYHFIESIVQRKIKSDKEYPPGMLAKFLGDLDSAFESLKKWDPDYAEFVEDMYQNDRAELAAMAGEAEAPKISSGTKAIERQVATWTPEQRKSDWKKNGIAGGSFKAWFGDWENDLNNTSKVIDEKTREPKETTQIDGTSSSQVMKDGKPMAVFHGTSTGGFDRFEKRWGSATGGGQAENLLYGPGMYFTEDPTIAEEYSKIGDDSEQASREVKQVFLNIRKPYDPKKPPTVDQWPESYKAEKIDEVTKAAHAAIADAAELRKGVEQARKEDPHQFMIGGEWHGADIDYLRNADEQEKWAKEKLSQLAAGNRDQAIEYKGFPSYHDLVAKHGSKQAANAWLQSAGFDGITHEGGDIMGGGKMHRVWIAFEPNQIKSTDNQGTFDPQDDRMQYAAPKDKGQRWITVDNGQHVLIDSNGRVHGGLGGNVSHIGEKDAKPGRWTKPKDPSPENAPEGSKRNPHSSVFNELNKRQQSHKSTPEGWDDPTEAKPKEAKPTKPEKQPAKQPTFPRDPNAVSASEQIPKWNQNAKDIADDYEKQKAEREAHPHHLNKLSDQIKKALLDWHYDAHAATKGIEQAAHGSSLAGTDTRSAKRDAWTGVQKQTQNDPHIAQARKDFKLPPTTMKIEGAKDQVTELAGRLQSMIKEHAAQGIDVKPFIKHNNLIPRPMAAKLKPNDSLFRPVTDEERFSAAFEEAITEQYAAKRPKNSPGQLGMFGDGLGGDQLRSTKTQQKMRWITIHPNGPGHKGTPVMITEDGTIQAGAGGKLNGTKLGNIHTQESKGPPPKSTPKPIPAKSDLKGTEKVAPKATSKAPQVNSHGVKVITNDDIGAGRDGTYDRLHAGLATESVQSKIAIGMKGIENREYAIMQTKGGKWQLASRPAEKTKEPKEKPGDPTQKVSIANRDYHVKKDGSQWFFSRDPNRDGWTVASGSFEKAIEAQIGKQKLDDQPAAEPPKDKPAGIEEAKLSNEKAKSGDQLGLIDGEGQRKAAPKFKTTDQGKAKQTTLIDGLDAGAGQMDFFGGDGTPDDMVYKPSDSADSATDNGVDHTVAKLKKSPHVTTAAQAEFRAKDEWHSLSDQQRSQFSGPKEFASAVGKAFQTDQQDTGPKDGDRNADGLVFRAGRWHRDQDTDVKRVGAETGENQGEPGKSVPTEPWQMTKDEHTAERERRIKKFRDLLDQHKTVGEAMQDPDVAAAFKAQEDWGDIDIGHKPAVAKAIKEGKFVPSHVLAEYPQLAEKAAQKEKAGYIETSDGQKSDGISHEDAKQPEPSAELKGKITETDKKRPAADRADKNGTPRQQSRAALDETAGDYEFARKSTIGNRGEDLIGSARHKVNAWRSLDEAENDGTAAEMVTRDNLLKNEPHEIGIHLDSNPVGVLTMNEAMRSFPAKPGYGRSTQSADDKKAARSQYLDVYRKVKAKAEEIAKAETDPVKASKELGSLVTSEIHRLRREHGSYNDTANGLCTFANRLHGVRGKNSLVRKVGDFMLAVKEHHSEAGIDGIRQALTGYTAKALEGKTLTSLDPRSDGKDGKKKPGKFVMRALYGHGAKRVGGRDLGHKTGKEAADYLDKVVGFRGVQWGNSMSDKERDHHAKATAHAVVDLAEIIGLKPEHISLDGKLGIAHGARGIAGAAAHYEPGTKVINMTRAHGAGTFAHEWMHAVDHAMGGGGSALTRTSSGLKNQAEYMSQNVSSETRSGKLVDGKWVSEKIDNTKDPLWSAMDKVRKSWESSGFNSRMTEELKGMARSGQVSNSGSGIGSRRYWSSSEEMLARSFEAYVTHKLGSEDRTNEYLSGATEHPLWPTKEEAKKMAPAFDELFKAYRKHATGSDEVQKFSATDRQAFIDRFTSQSRHAFIMEHYDAGAGQMGTKNGRKLVEGNQGDIGYFVTIGDNPVFVEAKTGKIARGPSSHRGKYAKQVPGKRLWKSKRIKSDRSGDRDSPGQIGAFGDGLGGDLVRGTKTQNRIGLQPSDPPSAPAKPTATKPAAKPAKHKPKSNIDKLAVDTVGDDPDDVAYFRELMDDAHAMLTNEANDTNDGLRQLLGHFGFTGNKTGLIVRRIRNAHNKGGDADMLARFDQMVDMAKRDIPHLLNTRQGESTGSGDYETALFERLRKGFEKPPTKTDDAVLKLAKEMFDAKAPTSSTDYDYDPNWVPDYDLPDDYDPFAPEPANDRDMVPFSVTFANAVIERYHSLAG